jgi:hypothetical protein
MVATGKISTDRNCNNSDGIIFSPEYSTACYVGFCKVEISAGTFIDGTIKQTVNNS